MVLDETESPAKTQSKVKTQMSIYFRDTSITDIPSFTIIIHIDPHTKHDHQKARWSNNHEVASHAQLAQKDSKRLACRKCIWISRFLGFRTGRAIRHLFYPD